jgi:putative ABC transport system permease protein
MRLAQSARPAAGIAVHQYVIPAMAGAAGLGVPSSLQDVCGAGELAALAMTGLVIALAGALLPAGWAARSRTVSALRAE